MNRQILRVFGVTEQRADELVFMYLDENQSMAEKIVEDVHTADLAINEKMFLMFVLGVFSTAEIVDVAPPIGKTYIH